MQIFKRNESEHCQVCGQYHECCDCRILPATATEPAEKIPRGGSELEPRSHRWNEPTVNQFGDLGYWAVLPGDHIYF